MLLAWILAGFAITLIYITFEIQRLGIQGRIRIDGPRDEEESLLDNALPSQRQNTLYKFISLSVLLMTGISCLMGSLQVPLDAEYSLLLILIDFLSLVIWLLTVTIAFFNETEDNVKVLARSNLLCFLSQTFLTIYWIIEMISYKGHLKSLMNRSNDTI